MRAELAKKDGQKSTQNGDPANAETAAKLAALLETEAKLRREVDEANSRYFPCLSPPAPLLT